MTDTTRFHPLPLHAGLLLDLGSVRVHGLSEAPTELAQDSTHFVLVTEGVCVWRHRDDERSLRAERYLVAPDGGTLQGGRGMVIEALRYRGLAQSGGPLEPRGRLRYVDGCSDTLLVSPPRLGEPCLNHLHIPAGTLQSSHEHDSLRLGVIARGRGRCRTAHGETELEPGLGWYIPAGLRHSFATDASALDVFAWHPNSDFGPTDRNHPMINRTRLLS
jgi:mannose-6-phosphate isomerase-like protein (cupin superfamily)